MAKYNFSGYSYTDDKAQKEDGSEFAFDSKKLDEFLSTYNYNGAVDYLKCFSFESPELQTRINNYIYEIERQGRIASVIYKNATPKQRQMLKFADSVFNDGALDKLQTEEDGNEYVDKFYKLKRKLGGEESQYLQISFPEAKRTLLGTGYVDWIAADNTRTTYAAFLKNTGYTDGFFRRNGIDIGTKDGRKTLTFKKSHPLANEILNNLDLGIEDYIFSVFGDDIEILGVDSNGQKVFSKGTFNSNNNNPKYNRYYIRQMQNMIESANDEKAMFFRNLNGGDKKIYSSTIGPALIDNAEDLTNSVTNRYMSQSQYNSIMKNRDAYIRNMTRVFSGGNYTLYSNYYNKDGDETLVEVDPRKVTEYTDMINSTDTKYMEVNSMICNGQIGVLITVNAEQKSGKSAEGLNSESELKDYIKRKRFQVFVPGLMYDDAQRAINSNTSTRAIKELNTMKDFNYTYTFDDGKELQYTRDGGFFYGEGTEGIIIDSDRAAKLLDRDFSIKDSIQALRREYLTAGNKITNEEELKNTIKLAAIRIANSIYDDSDPIPYDEKDIVGSLNKIFGYRGAGNFLKSEYSDKLSEKDSKKYNNMFRIYGDILKYFIENYNVKDN